MNLELMREAGFNEEVDLLENKCCPFCTEDMHNPTLRDALSAREFEISGLCQRCQDNIFGSPYTEDYLQGSE